MCGRFAMDAKTDDLIREYVEQGGKPEDWWHENAWSPRVSIAPTNRFPVVRDDPDRGLDMVRWGRPKPPSMGRGDIINARVEKLAGGFWKPWMAERVIVPMTGYFEWLVTPSGRDPVYLHTDGLLSAAGVTKLVDTGKGEPERVVVIVTRDGVDAAGEVHDRMPLFISRDLRGDWLTPGVPADMGGLLDAVDAGSTEVARSIIPRPISRRINSVSKIDPYDRSLLDSV